LHALTETLKCDVVSKRTLIGVLTPSSNTALEPLTSAMLAQVPNVSAHFSRFRVTEISLGEQSQSQFQFEAILQAAKLLADAWVDVIVWSGTSASWLGFDRDEALCAAITNETGIPACTSVLALNEIMQITQRKKFGLVTPYLADVQQKIVDNYSKHGYICSAERHSGLSVNYSFSEVSESTLFDMASEVALSKPQCITTLCTNLRAAHCVEKWEAELGVPAYDSVSTAVWKSLKMCQVDTRLVKGWGSLFQEVH
jgi:maleate isomerase